MDTSLIITNTNSWFGVCSRLLTAFKLRITFEPNTPISIENSVNLNVHKPRSSALFFRMGVAKSRLTLNLEISPVDREIMEYSCVLLVDT